MRQRLNTLPIALRALILLIALVLSIFLLLGIVGIVNDTFERLSGSQGKEPKQATTAEKATGQGATCEEAQGKSVFIQRATSENIIENSTYLDNPQTNDNPEAVLFVAQNWNPEGSSGTYNDHSIGIWYDTDRKQWAIFNEDGIVMPVGAAFNVAICR
jgi:hypothetical protein